jgi:hypothetical protein
MTREPADTIPSEAKDVSVEADADQGADVCQHEQRCGSASALSVADPRVARQGRAR